MVQKSGDHQLRLAVYSIIYKVLAPSQVVIAGFLVATNSMLVYQDQISFRNMGVHHRLRVEKVDQSSW